MGGRKHGAAVHRLRRLRDEVRGPQEGGHQQPSSSRGAQTLPAAAQLSDRVPQQFGAGCWLHAPLAGQFGARLTGVDLSVELTAHQTELLLQIFEAYKVLVIPSCSTDGVCLTDFERLANHIGRPIPHPSVRTRVIGHPNVQLMTNVSTADGDEGRSAVVPSPYHTDLDYETEPASASMILCHTAPPLGAQTSFIDMGQAWDEQPNDALRETAMRLCVLRDGFSEVKPLAARNVSPIVRRHPRTGRESLHVSHPDLMRQFFAIQPGEDPVANRRAQRGYALGVALETCPWPGGEAEGRRLVQELRDRVLRPARLRQCEYLHNHEPGCVIVWDNLSLMHTGPINGRRVPYGELSSDLQQLARCDAVAPQSWKSREQAHQSRAIVGQREHREGADAEARILFRIGVKGPGSVLLPRRDSAAWVAQHIIAA